MTTGVLDALASIRWTASLFVLTELAEIVECFLPYLWLRKGASAWLLLPAAAALAAFAWLLTLHPAGAGGTYAVYDGAYVATAVGWLGLVEGEQPDRWDIVGAMVGIVGMAIIVLGPRKYFPSLVQFAASWRS